MNISGEPRSRTDVGAQRPPERWRLSDVLRLAGVLTVPLAWWIAGPAAGAAISLVWGGQMAVRSLLRPGFADWGLQLLFLASGWFAVLGAYQAVSWLDIPMHFLSTGAVAWLAWAVLVGSGGLPAQASSRAETVAQVVVITALGAVASVLWELGEWYGYSFTVSDVGVGYDDTIGDMFFGTLGALATGLLTILPDRR